MPSDLKLLFCLQYNASANVDLCFSVCHPHVVQICIIIGVLLLVLSPIGGLRQIILAAKTYKFYQ